MHCTTWVLWCVAPSELGELPISDGAHLLHPDASESAAAHCYLCSFVSFIHMKLDAVRQDLVQFW